MQIVLKCTKIKGGRNKKGSKLRYFISDYNRSTYNWWLDAGNSTNLYETEEFEKRNNLLATWRGESTQSSQSLQK